MEKVILENSFLKLNVNSQGAELSSVFDKNSQREIMWQADEQVWPWHAPNLFPVVGQTQNNQIRVNETDYPLRRHGFARNSLFTVLSSQASHAVFSLRDSEETLKSYPFHFEFQILYDLLGDTIRITYKVINHDTKDIFFSVGAHPAFAIKAPEDPLYKDYYLEFSEPSPAHISILNTQGLFSGKTADAPICDGKMFLSPELFMNDALVFKEIPTKTISLKRLNSNQKITISFSDFPYLGIWSKPGSSFICIEPWLGCADSEGEQTELKNKEAIHQLGKGHVFEAAFSISITN